MGAYPQRDYLHCACTVRAPLQVLEQIMGKRSFLGSLVPCCSRTPHSEAEMKVAGTLSPFDRIQVTVMPAGSHESDMGETVRGPSICNGNTFYSLETHALQRRTGG